MEQQNNDIRCVHSLLVSLVKEHLDESISISNSEVIDLYITKLKEVETNIYNNIQSKGEVSSDKIEEAKKLVHDIVYPEVIMMAIRDYEESNENQ